MRRRWQREYEQGGVCCWENQATVSPDDGVRENGGELEEDFDLI